MATMTEIRKNLQPSDCTSIRFLLQTLRVVIQEHPEIVIAAQAPLMRRLDPEKQQHQLNSQADACERHMDQLDYT